MNKQNLNLTTPKLLEYAAKAVMLASTSYWAINSRDKSRATVDSKGYLTVAFTVDGTTYFCRVRLGDFPKYSAFVERLLDKLGNLTGMNYTEKDLNIY